MQFLSFVNAACAAALSLCPPTDSWAQTSPFSFHGSVQIERSFGPGGAQNRFALYDFGIAYRADAAQGFGWGADLGVYGFGDDVLPWSNFPLESAAVFATVSVPLAGGRLSLGLPRPASDGFRRAPASAGSIATQRDLERIAGITPLMTSDSINFDQPFVGLRYDIASGPVTFAATAARADLGWMVLRSVSAGVGLRIGGYRAHLTGETVDYGFGRATTYSAGSSYTLTNVAGAQSVELGWEAWAKTPLFGPEVRSTSLFAVADVNDRLQVLVTGWRFSGLIAFDALGVGLSYDAWQGVRVSLGAERAGGANRVTFGVGYRL